MEILHAIIMGIIQGATEFLPISSSAHLVLTPWLFGWEDSFLHGLTFDVALHWGTLLAVIAYFWRDWVQMIDAAARRLLRKGGDGEAAKLFWFVALATIPGGVAGLLFEEQAESVFRAPWLIATVMGLFAVVLLCSELIGRRTRNLERIGPLEAVGIGLLQALAIIPGVSRSGITMTGGLFVNLRRDAAARFSFLLLTPIVLGTAVKTGGDLITTGLPQNEWLPLILGVLAAALVGYACIGLLLRFLQLRSFVPFVVYRVGLALGIFAVILLGMR